MHAGCNEIVGCYFLLFLALLSITESLALPSETNFDLVEKRHDNPLVAIITNPIIGMFPSSWHNGLYCLRAHSPV